jgi:hypothetical protein
LWHYEKTIDLYISINPSVPAVINLVNSRLKGNLRRERVMVGEETSGALSMAVGGGLLTFVIGTFVLFGSTSYDQGAGATGMLIYGTMFGFLAFLMKGYGLFSVVRAATSTSRR